MNTLWNALQVLQDALEYLLVAAILLAASILLYRKHREWPVRLQLIGAIAYALYSLHNFVFIVAVSQFNVRHGTFWFPTDTENQLISVPFGIMYQLSILFPVGLLWHSLRVCRGT
jgi:peptidoglycan/LPS O-acetylase OafA/YrhL